MKKKEKEELSKQFHKEGTLEISRMYDHYQFHIHLLAGKKKKYSTPCKYNKPDCFLCAR